MRGSWAARALVTMALAALLAGCGAEGDPEATAERSGPAREVNVALNGFDGPENVGILMADELGYFHEAGLFPMITSPLPPERVVAYVTGGTVDIGVSHQPQVVLAREAGAPIVAVGSLISQPTAAMIWLEKSKIDGVADLKGKTVAIPGLPFQRSFLQSALARAGLTLKDVRVEVAGYDLVPALVKGRADAIFGGSRNFEGAVLQARGLQPVVTPVTSLGIPSYDELTSIVRRDFLAQRPQLVRDFMSAVARGTAAAIEDPEAAVEVVEDSVEADPDLGPRATEAAIEATLPLLSESAYMNPGQAGKLVGWMREEGMVQGEMPVSELLTNDYLPSSP